MERITITPLTIVDRVKILLIRFWLKYKFAQGLVLVLCRKISLKGPGGSITIFFSGIQDFYTFKEIFLEEQYKLSTSNARVIVDIGANVGFSVAYFYLHYPQATIRAVEPDPRAYVLLKKICEQDSRLQCYQKAIASTIGTLDLHIVGGSTFSSSLLSRKGETGSYTVKTDTLSNFLKDLPSVDIMKIDTEGGEQFIFEDPAISKAKVLVGEVHPDLMSKSFDIDTLLHGFTIDKQKRKGLRYNFIATKNTVYIFN